MTDATVTVTSEEAQASETALEKGFSILGDLFSGGLSFGAAALIFLAFLIMIYLAYVFGKEREKNRYETHLPDPPKPEQIPPNTTVSDLIDFNELQRKDGLAGDGRTAAEIEADLKKKLEDF